MRVCVQLYIGLQDNSVELTSIRLIQDWILSFVHFGKQSKKSSDNAHLFNVMVSQMLKIMRVSFQGAIFPYELHRYSPKKSTANVFVTDKT